MSRSIPLVVAAALMSLVLSGCIAGADRAGGEPAPDPVTLTAVAVQDGLELPPYIDAVQRLSKGSVALRVKKTWRLGDLSAEEDAIQYVRDGRADLAFVPARAWHAAGYHSFDALVAPLAIDSYAAQRQVLASGVPTKMLDAVSRNGMTGLGILPGPLRKPVGVRSDLLGADDYQSKTIGISPSAVAARFFAQLHAESTESSFQGQPITAFDGIEQQMASVQGNMYDEVVSTITANVNLWPRPTVIVANTRALRRLGKEQQHALARAARVSLDETLQLQQSTERESIDNMCRHASVRFVIATPADLSSLRAAAQPVLAWLGQDPTTRDYLERILKIRHEVAVSTAAEGVPTCDGIVPDPTTQRATAGKPGPMDGTWTMSETAADVVATGAPGNDLSQALENSGDWVFVVDRERFAFTQRNGEACTWAYGTWVVSGDQVEWRVIDGGGIAPTGASNKPGELFDYHWSLYRDTLTLSKVDGAVSPENFFGNPWHRVSTQPQPERYFKRCGLPASAVPR